MTTATRQPTPLSIVTAPANVMTILLPFERERSEGPPHAAAIVRVFSDLVQRSFNDPDHPQDTSQRDAALNQLVEAAAVPGGLSIGVAAEKFRILAPSKGMRHESFEGRTRLTYAAIAVVPPGRSLFSFDTTLAVGENDCFLHFNGPACSLFVSAGELAKQEIWRTGEATEGVTECRFLESVMRDGFAPKLLAMIDGRDEPVEYKPAGCSIGASRDRIEGLRDEPVILFDSCD